MRDNEVAVAHAAEAAPVQRALVHDQNIPDMTAGGLGGPHAGKTSSNDQNICLQSCYMFIHFESPIKCLPKCRG